MPITTWLGFLGVRGNQLVEPSDARSALRAADATPAASRSASITINVVVVFRPVIPDEDHPSPLLTLLSVQPVQSLRAPGGDLMDQCS